MDIVQEIGAYAGFAAVLGLAVLSALYFSQSRDLRQLREWVAQGRARVPEQAAPAAAVPQRRVTAPHTPVAAPQAMPAGAPRPAAAPVRPGAVPASARQATASGGAPAPAPASASGATAVGARPPAPANTRPPAPATARPAAPVPGSQGQRTAPRGPVVRPVPGQTSSSERPAQRRGLRGMAPRYVALVAAGVLIVGGGLAFGVMQLLSDDNSPQAASSKTPDARAGGGPVEPGSVTVSVLNGTTVLGLPAQVGDEVESAGFQRGNVANASEQARPESAVQYRAGQREAARAVAKALEIATVEPIDPQSQSLAGDASVVVIVGADQTQ